MKYIPVLPFSLVNLVLNAISVITIFVLPEKEVKIYSTGHIELNSNRQGPFYEQATCKEGEGGLLDRCDFTDTNVTSPQTVTSAGTAIPNLNTSANVDGNSTGLSGHNTGTHDDGSGTLISNK